MKILATISNKWIFLELCFGLLEINSLSITFHRTHALFPGSEVESFPFSCYSVQFSSVTQSCLTLRPHGLQQARLPCPSPAPGACSKLMSIKSVVPSNHLILWCPLLLLLSIFPGIKVFSNESVLRMRWPSSGSSASASVLPMNIQDRSPLAWTGWMSLQSKGLSRVFPNTTVQKHQFFCAQLSSQSNFTSIHDHWKNSHILTWLLEKP